MACHVDSVARRRWVRAGALALTMLALACSTPAPSEEGIGAVTQPILGGRDSTSREDHAVHLVKDLPDGGRGTRCSATLVAPNLVVTARHCTLLNKADELPCTPGGDPKDPSDPRTQDLRGISPDLLTVYVGSDASAFASSARVRKIVVPSDVSLCRNDVAFLVLERDLAPIHLPIRVAPLVAGLKFDFSGWGMTSEASRQFPTIRQTREQIRIDDVGPGFIPPATFAIAGNTLCYGDSGGGAIVDGALAGVYSRIEGACSDPAGRSIFASFGAVKDVVASAFEAAGRSPWLHGEPPPWSATQSAACDGGDGCGSPEAGPAAPAAEHEASGCAVNRRSDSAATSCVAAAVALLALARRVRRAKS